MNSFPTTRFPGLPLAQEKRGALEINQGSRSQADEEDDVLLCRIQAHDRDALAVLFQRYARLIRCIAARILRDSAEAEDLVQDLFLFIQRKCAVFDSSKSTARSWIVQMAYHRAIERRRYLTSRQFYSRMEIESNTNHMVGTPTNESDYSAEA